MSPKGGFGVSTAQARSIVSLPVACGSECRTLSSSSATSARVPPRGPEFNPQNPRRKPGVVVQTCSSGAGQVERQEAF